MFGWFRDVLGGPGLGLRPPNPKEPMSEDALRTALRRSCAPLVFDKPANIDPFETMFGAVRLARPDEAWPLHDGVPMWPLCQINLTQAPVIPASLHGIALITIFVRDADTLTHTPVIDTARPDPAATWCLRSYPTLEGLTIPKAPAHHSPLSPRLGEWAQEYADYPTPDDAGQIVDPALNDVFAYDWYQTLSRTKLGGWPAALRSTPLWHGATKRDPWDFALQLENEPKAGWRGWGDGAAFIARSRKRPQRWAIDVQQA